MKLEKCTSKQFGDFTCCKCGEPLIGRVVTISEVNDDEGREWRSLHHNCYEEVVSEIEDTDENKVLDYVYNKYNTNEPVGGR